MVWSLPNLSLWSQTHSCFYANLYRKLKVGQGQDQSNSHPNPPTIKGKLSSQDTPILGNL